MEFQFHAITEPFTTEKSHLIYELCSTLNVSFVNKSFGKDVTSLHVTFLLILGRPDYPNWYKPKKMMYIDHKLKKSKLTGEIIEINNQLAFEIQLDEKAINLFINSYEIRAKGFITDLIVDYLLHTKTWPKKIKDFDSNALLRELRIFADKLITT
jgi:hypothetical protein